MADQPIHPWAIFARFSARLVAEPMTPKRSALLALVHALILSWGFFLACTLLWWTFFRFSSVPYPFKWIVLVSIILGALLAHALWRIRRRRKGGGR